MMTIQSEDNVFNHIQLHAYPRVSFFCYYIYSTSHKRSGNINLTHNHRKYRKISDTMIDGKVMRTQERCERKKHKIVQRTQKKEQIHIAVTHMSSIVLGFFSAVQFLLFPSKAKNQ